MFFRYCGNKVFTYLLSYQSTFHFTCTSDSINIWYCFISGITLWARGKVLRMNEPMKTSALLSIKSWYLMSNVRFWLCQVGWLVGCGLTSHSVIFQLYSDGTDVQFPNFDLLPGTQCHGQLGVFSVPSLLRHGHRDVQRRLFTSLPSEGHTWWGKPGIEPGSSDPQSSPLPLRHRGGWLCQD